MMLKYLRSRNKIAEDAKHRAEKEEIERREQEAREAAERLLQENEVRPHHIPHLSRPLPFNRGRMISVR